MNDRGRLGFGPRCVGEEQLFDLRDRAEISDLAGDAAHAGELRRWRGRMVDHLSERGEKWVKGGKLALRPENMMTGVNFPRSPK